MNVNKESAIKRLHRASTDTDIIIGRFFQFFNIIRPKNSKRFSGLTLEPYIYIYIIIIIIHNNI